jgi:hypothetical protein
MRELWWMAGGRWEFGTGQLANFAAAVMSPDHAAANPFKPDPAAAEAKRRVEKQDAWAALREHARQRAADYRKKHGHKAGGTPNGTGRG